jgi:hypothetical protein
VAFFAGTGFLATGAAAFFAGAAFLATGAAAFLIGAVLAGGVTAFAIEMGVPSSR